MIPFLCAMAVLPLAVDPSPAPPVSAAAPWSADPGDGTYRNPILHADYSDPDAVRVGDDFWMVSSSFTHVPGLPILHSTDLVNWQLVAYALPRLIPADAFATPQHGKGVWAPSIRHHAGKFWIYYPDPDFGLYLTTATDPRGPWTTPVLVLRGKGLIDPCPLWDDDGQLYLIHGWARSRAGIANVLTLLRLTPGGTGVAEDFGIVVNGDAIPGYTTLEGPKLYRRDGWYYIFAPAGGVKTGWQSVFRSRKIQGPYEPRIVLAQGRTPVNGPHQGALVDTPNGDSWFLHFQDQGAYGRIVHLQPVAWKDHWPVIGVDADGDGCGEPVLTHRKPTVGSAAPSSAAPAVSAAPALVRDDFDAPVLSLLWQWPANPRPEWYSLAARPGFLRLVAQPAPRHNLHQAPHLLLQKFPTPAFTVTTRLEFDPLNPADAAGLLVFGDDYAWIGVRGDRLVLHTAHHAHAEPAAVTETPLADHVTGAIELRVTVTAGARCHFSFSRDGQSFTPVDGEFTAVVSRWVGAKVGLFALAAGTAGATADFDSFQVDDQTR